jgi:hypothetical protein
VPRRVDLERDERADLPDRHRFLTRREDLGVLQHVPHLGFAPDHHHAAVLHLHEGPGVAQEAEERLRMGEVVRIDIVGHIEQAHSHIPPDRPI